MWKIFNKNMTLDHLGLIPMIIRADDPRPVKEQVQERYAHGGGWMPFGADKWKLDGENCLKYPDDPKLEPLAHIEVNDEQVYFYDMAIVCVIHANGSFSVIRMD